MRTTTRMGVIAASILLLAGCSAPAEAPAPTTSADESAYGGFAIDPPADDEVVLKIEAGRTVDFTYAELQALATVEIEIFEPFVEQRQSFTGVPLAELLGAADVAADARIETVALNDYRYAALLAVLRDGELIPMDQGGPIRIVFAEDSPAYELLDAWNWSLRSIVVVD